MHATRGICLFHLSILIVYFFEYGVSRRMYVSDALFHHLSYFRPLLLCALAMQWAVFVRAGGPAIAVAICAIGWSGVCTTDGPIHMAAVLIYMLGDLNAFVHMWVRSRMSAAMLAPSIASMACGGMYLALWSIHNDLGPLFEHASLIFEACAFTVYAWTYSAQD